MLAVVAMAIRLAERFRALIALFSRIALGRPISVEVRGQQEHTQMRETHAVQRFESWPEIGAVRERAATAVHHEIRRFGNGAGPFFQVIQALRRGGRSVERRSGDVSALVEKMRSDTYYCRLVAAGEFLRERGRLDCLSGGPRL